jgi:DNA-directed RNA polymerase-3 subunit RPC5
MGTGGTVGSTQQIRQKLVQKIQKEAEDVWKPWKWDDVASPEVVDTLAQFLVPPDRRAMLECKTAPLDIISKKNIGEGARL